MSWDIASLRINKVDKFIGWPWPLWSSQGFLNGGWDCKGHADPQEKPPGGFGPQVWCRRFDSFTSTKNSALWHIDTKQSTPQYKKNDEKIHRVINHICHWKDSGEVKVLTEHITNPFALSYEGNTSLSSAVERRQPYWRMLCHKFKIAEGRRFDSCSVDYGNKYQQNQLQAPVWAYW